MTGVQGWADPAFEAVREVFAANLGEGRDLGASVAVCVDGRPVVDLWGGVADERTGRAWGQDTACVVFSCTKAVTATAALAVAHDVGIDPDEPVAGWWPEYAVAGKESTTLADMLTHRAGLPVFEQPITVAEAADAELMARTLAAQGPMWRPGSEHGYHALTFGWLVGEFVRRHTQSTVGEYVRGHFGAELRIGVSADEAARAARLARPPAAEMVWTDDSGPIDADAAARVAEAYRDPDSLLMRSSSNPAAAYNNSDVLAGGWPASGLVVTARALAGFYRDLVAGKLLPQAVLAAAKRERVRGVDAVLQLETAFGWGYMLPSQNFVLPDIAAPTAFGHPGAGGSIGIGDVDNRVAIAFVPNLRRDWLAGDRRAYDLVAAVYECL